MFVALPLAWSTCMVAPILVFMVRFRTSRPAKLAVKASVTLALVVMAWLLSVEFLWRPLNWVALSAGYFAWATLVGLAFLIQPKWLGAVLGVAGMASFLPGLLLGTIGILGLVFVVGDYTDPPAHSETIAPGLDCVVTNWGNVTSDDGHEVHLYRYLPWFPVLRHQVRHVIVNETHPVPGLPTSTGCLAVSREVR